MINVLLHEEGRRNRKERKKKKIVGKRLLEQKSVKVKEWRTVPSFELIKVAVHSK